MAKAPKTAAPAAAPATPPAEAPETVAPVESKAPIGATVHFYDRAMASAGHAQGAGPYAAIVVGGCGDTGVFDLQVLALGLHRPSYAMAVHELDDARARCPADAEPPRYWTRPTGI